MITIDQFMELDLRTATIVDACRVPETDKLVKLEVDDGSGTRTLVAGIAASYETEQLAGMSIIIVANLQPATIRGVESQGMALAADVDGRPVLATFAEEIPNGAKVR